MKILCSFAVILAVSTWTATVDAAPIAYDIVVGETLGFDHSYLTTAETPVNSHPGFFSGGAQANITGALKGDLSATTLAISPSTLSLTGVGIAPFNNDIWTIEFTGGSLTVPPSAFTNSGTLLGTLDYVIRDPFSTVHDTGSFYVFDFSFAGFANGISNNGIYIWANNWNNLTTDRNTFIINGGLPLGIDIGGVGSFIPVPEPSQLVLALMGLMTLFAWRAIRPSR